MVASADDLTHLGTLDFGKGDGLIPAIVQHAGTGAVLMLGYMNREALIATLARRRAVFFSRSKGRLWEKGEASGHSLDVEDVKTDCDHDTLLIRAWPRGPVCHSGSATCFGDDAGVQGGSVAFLATLERVIEERAAASSEGSYTARLLAAGSKRVAQKVGEEGLEAALAGAGGSDSEVVNEVADLFYHVLVMLRTRGLNLEQVVRELEERRRPDRS